MSKKEEAIRKYHQALESIGLALSDIDRGLDTARDGMLLFEKSLNGMKEISGNKKMEAGDYATQAVKILIDRMRIHDPLFEQIAYITIRDKIIEYHESN